VLVGDLSNPNAAKGQRSASGTGNLQSEVLRVKAPSSTSLRCCYSFLLQGRRRSEEIALGLVMKNASEFSYITILGKYVTLICNIKVPSEVEIQIEASSFFCESKFCN
jgi:hypothetical protein